MTKILKILTPVFGVMFLFLFVLTIINIINNPFLAGSKLELEAKSRHYAFFVPDSEYSFFRKLKEGALQACREADCAVSFHSIDTDPMSLDMVRYSGVDGLAVYLYKGTDDYLSVLSDISGQGIPVVQIENEVIKNSHSFFIGTNSFETGKGFARIAQRAAHNQLNLTLIYSEKNPGLMADTRLLEMGLKQILGSKLRSFQTYKTSLNPLDVERLIYALMQETENTNMIVLTDLKDTLVAVQAIIDMNLVGAVEIVGFGDDLTVREYIQKNIVLGSIARNPHLIGSNTVRALNEINTDGYTSAYCDTGISIITKKNNASKDLKKRRYE